MGPVLSNNISVHLIWYGSWSSGSKVTQSVTLGQEKNDRLSHGRKLTRLAVQSVISIAIRAKTNPLPTDPTGGLYLVLTSSDIIVEGFCQSICGFLYFTFPSIVGYTLPFAWVGNSEKMCDDPNFQTEVADLCEGLYGRGGGGAYVGEILTDATGAAYNLSGYRRKFLVQWIYSNVGNRCVGPN
ncbi:putative protein EXORDIUM [Helianthus annuus]|nr:putative protein EXORDIUM [Helianthus annuus]KAJ0883055.1 putative protein EXORDIUM [Helianthus annuus]